jgi:hypothetical protein
MALAMLPPPMKAMDSLLLSEVLKVMVMCSLITRVVLKASARQPIVAQGQRGYWRTARSRLDADAL